MHNFNLDYSWLCNFRASMTQNIRSTNPFYLLVFTTPMPQGYSEVWSGQLLSTCLAERRACHCMETMHFFGMALDWGVELLDEEIEHIENIQNIIGNFVRTGDPNDWTGNTRPWQEITQINTWRDSRMFNMFGIYGQYPENYRTEYCDKLDEMDEYMEH